MLLAKTLFVLVFAPLSAFAQNDQYPEVVRCAYDELRQQLLERRPEAREREQARLEQWAEWKAPAAKTSDAPYRIPVVFHVLHENGPENIPDSQIRSQMEVLNEDFQKLAGTPGDGPGANPLIEFYLAQIDPFGECSNGITRHVSPYTNAGLSLTPLQEIVYWPGINYLNVYVVKDAGSTGGGPVLGYYNGMRFSDAVVVRSKNIGRTGIIAPPHHTGRTLTHEVGHWLGLKHPFQRDGTCDGNTRATCRTAGDWVCDTPAEYDSDNGCYEPENSCIDVPVDYLDLPGLYMNYYDDECMDRFTPGQVELMHFTLLNEMSNIFSEDNLIRTGYYGCETTSRRNMDFDDLPDLQLYPNPAQDKLTVSFSNPLHSAWQAEAYALNGKIAATYQLTADNGNVVRELDVSHLAAGVYTLVFINQNGARVIASRFAIH